MKKIWCQRNLSRFLVAAASFGFAVTSSAASGQHHQAGHMSFHSEQGERIEALESSVDELTEAVGSRAVVHAFDAEQLTLGGFLHTAFTHVQGEDRTANSLNRLTFELLGRAQLSPQWAAFVAQAFIRETNITYIDSNGYGRREPEFHNGSKTPLVIAWANYAHNDAINVRFGRFITPQGIINIEHFPAILLDTEQPQFLRPFGGQSMFPNFVNGIQVLGRLNQDGYNKVQYHVFGASFSGFPGNNNASTKDYENFLAGVRVSDTFGSTGIRVGLNAVRGRRRSNRTSGYKVIGADLFADRGQLLFKSEIFHSTQERLGRDRTGYYLQPAWRLTPKWIVFFRHDYFKPGEVFGNAASSDSWARVDGGRQSTEEMFGVNYLPSSNVRLRATLTHQEDKGGTVTEQGGSGSSRTTTTAKSWIGQLSATLSF